MDKSNLHLSMVDCIEVQGRWEPALFDYVKSPQGKIEINRLHRGSTKTIITKLSSDMLSQEQIVELSSGIITPEDDLSLFLWLPRQDQYWDMVADSLGCIHERGYWCQDCHEAIGEFMRGDHPSIINLIMSKADALTREIVLLVFYMKEAHGKTWDGRMWEK